MLDVFDVKDKVFIITGSASGIGKDAAKSFLELGAKVCLNSRKAERLNPVMEEMKNYGDNVMGVIADGRREDEAFALVEQVKNRYGRVDVLINNAGGSFPIKTTSLSANGFSAVVQTNLNTVFNFSKAVFPVFKEQGGGKIINISSIAGLQPTPHEAHYGASKAAVNHLTTTLAHEWGPYNIKVNAIAPGPILTKLAEEHLWSTPEKKRMTEQRIALGRIGSTKDIFYACLYFASEASDYVTGAILRVDGGAKPFEVKMDE